MWILLAWLSLPMAVWPVAKHFLESRHSVSIADLASSEHLLNQGKYSEAIAAAQRYLEQKPDSAQAWTNIGFAYGRLNNWDQAIEATHRAILLQPNDQLAWNNLRWMLKSQLDAHPTPEAHFDNALLASRSQDFKACEQEAGKAVGLYPEYARAWNLVAVCDLNLRLYDAAEAAAKRALEIEPSFEPARANLALVMNSRTAAPATLPPPAPRSPSAEDLVNSSMAHYRAKDMKGCVGDAKKALALNPNLAVAYNNIAACSNDLGRYDEAITAAQQALRIQPSYPLAINNLTIAVNQKKAQAGQQ